MATTFEIYPAIGIARVGTSQNFFVGPEADVTLDMKRRDNSGDFSKNLLRQAARFRIFQCERDGSNKLLSATEVTPAQASIQWSVHLANRKGAAPKFNDTGRRNGALGNDAADAKLIIDPGIRSVGKPGQKAVFDTGKFMDFPVPLGEISMEASGRLIVLGGFGTSEQRGPDPIREFANNDGWHDDISDGPVSATVKLLATGDVVDAKGAWVIVAPPDFAPEIANLITLYDVLYDLAIARGVLSPPTEVFFDRDIRPILTRAMGYRWVNSHANDGHGPGGPGEFDLVALGDPSQSNFLRARIFKLLREPNAPPRRSVPSNGMPRLNDSVDSGDVLPLTKTQYGILRMWSQGQFQASAPAGDRPPLPDELTRIALEACAGGAFFPGIEAGQILTDRTRYMDGEAFRLLPPPKNKPGEITSHNAVPWQADFNQCRWEDDRGKNLGWWPAQRPDDVFKSVAATAPEVWANWSGGDFDSMLSNWHRLGFVKRDPEKPDFFTEQDRDPGLP